MKTLKRILFILFGFIVFISLVGLAVIWRINRRALPDYKHDLVLNGLEKPVKIYYDSVGIPHIYAATEHDLYMASGFIIARERMWQMDLLRRVTLGRLSEIFGEDYIKTDLLLRSLRYSEKSKRILENSSPEIADALQAFADGVNSYIDQQHGKFPVEFLLLGYKPEKWESYQSLNLIGYMAWDLKSGWSELAIEKIAAKVDSIHLVGLLPDRCEKINIFNPESAELLSSNLLFNLKKVDELGCDILAGSNNWAVSGEKSISGKPLLANDMHLGYSLPGIWFQIHQVVEGKLNVAGLIIPGEPFVVVGHNDSIAWGMTNTYVDNLDYYEEKINPADSNQYLLNGEWKNFEIRNETIKCKGDTIYKRQYRLNHRGPVVSEFKGVNDKVLTIRWVGDLESNEVRSIYLVNRARNWQDFKDAFSTFKSISQNIAYADCRGNIGLYCCAGVPVRKRDRIFGVLPGWTDEYDWKGIVPFEELPHLYNPDCGYVVSANNKTTSNDYPYHIGTWYTQPYRYARIKQMLVSKEKFSVDDFKRMQNDFVSAYASKFLKVTIPILKSKKDWQKEESNVLDIIQSWDYNMLPAEIAPTVFEAWRRNLTEQLFKDELGEENFNLFIGETGLSSYAVYNILGDTSSVWSDNIKTAAKESFADIVCLSFQNTIQQLSHQFGTDMQLWKWGDIHKITFRHPLSKVKILDKVFNLNRGPYSVGGSNHTVSPYSYGGGKPDEVAHGSSHRNIYDLSNWDQSFSVIPTGNSGISSDRFYCNQTNSYITGKYHPDFYTSDLVRVKKLYEINLLPE
jgi:penicillin G amidase